MTPHRKRWLTLVAAAAATTALTGCVATGGTQSGSSGEDAEGPLVIQSLYTDKQKDALTALVAGFEEETGLEVTVNSMDDQTLRSQMPTYLTSANPPDLYTYFAGSATQGYAEEGLLLDVSSVWEDDITDYSDALKSLSTTDGKQYFVPMGYYWWSVYYRKSAFEDYGVEPPKTWDEFLAVSQQIQDAGGTPITIGLSDAEWLLAAWFDYLDVRINGGQYHLDLLAGKHKFTDPEVVTVMETLGEALPYFDQDALGETLSSSTTKLINNEAAMYLSGSFIQSSFPEEDQGDIGFFRFPIIDPDVPVVEEAPTDGFVASANTSHPNAVREFLKYAASADGNKMFAEGQGSTNLPANSTADVELDALSEQGKSQLESASQLTQFYNRDASDELLTPATTALTKFFSNPDDLEAILAEWQSAVERIRE